MNELKLSVNPVITDHGRYFVLFCFLFIKFLLKMYSSNARTIEQFECGIKNAKGQTHLINSFLYPKNKIERHCTETGTGRNTTTSTPILENIAIP